MLEQRSGGRYGTASCRQACFRGDTFAASFCQTSSAVKKNYRSRSLDLTTAKTETCLVVDEDPSGLTRFGLAGMHACNQG